MSSSEDPRHAHPDAHRHEHSDASAAGVAKFVVGLVLVIACAMLLMLWVQDLLRTTRSTPQAVEREQQPPDPRLQSNPTATFDRLRSDEDARLESYGWTDRQKNQARIPIERAMQLTVERGLPAPPDKQEAK